MKEMCEDIIHELQVIQLNCQIKTNSLRFDSPCFRYDSSTGTFTVPPGGDGFYYFSSFLTAHGDESGTFDVELNGELTCTVYNDFTESPSSDYEITTCNGVAYAVEGICNTLTNISDLFILISLILPFCIK